MWFIVFQIRLLEISLNVSVVLVGGTVVMVVGEDKMVVVGGSQQLTNLLMNSIRRWRTIMPMQTQIYFSSHQKLTDTSSSLHRDIKKASAEFCFICSQMVVDFNYSNFFVMVSHFYAYVHTGQSINAYGKIKLQRLKLYMQVMIVRY